MFGNELSSLLRKAGQFPKDQRRCHFWISPKAPEFSLFGMIVSRPRPFAPCRRLYFSADAQGVVLAPAVWKFVFSVSMPENFLPQLPYNERSRSGEGLDYPLQPKNSS